MIKTNKDVDQYFWVNLEDFKQKFNNDNFVFLLLSCKQYQSLFPDKINKKNSHQTEIDYLVWVYENYLKKNIYNMWIDNKDYVKLFELLQGISHNKNALTLIYNDYEALIWEHTVVINRQNEIDNYVAVNILQCMENNLSILFGEDSEIIWNEKNQQEIEKKIESMCSIVRDILYKSLDITDKEKNYINSIIDKSIETTLDKIVDIQEIDKHTVKIAKKLF